MGTLYYVKSLLIIFLIYVSISAHSQKVIPDIKISVSYENTRLEEILDNISDAGNINFSYNPKKIPLDLKISIHAEDEYISSVLDKICKKASLSFEYVEQQVIKFYNKRIYKRYTIW